MRDPSPDPLDRLEREGVPDLAALRDERDPPPRAQADRERRRDADGRAP